MKSIIGEIKPPTPWGNRIIMMKILEVQEKGKEEETRVNVDTGHSLGFSHVSPKNMNENSYEWEFTFSWMWTSRHVLSNVAIHAVILSSTIDWASAKRWTPCEGWWWCSQGQDPKCCLSQGFQATSLSDTSPPQEKTPHSILDFLWVCWGVCSVPFPVPFLQVEGLLVSFPLVSQHPNESQP